MLCRLCLEESAEYQLIFGPLNISETLKKHFDFDILILENDPVSTVVCDDCWKAIHSFHQFHERIKNSQCRYTKIHCDLNNLLKPEIANDCHNNSDMDLIENENKDHSAKKNLEVSNELLKVQKNETQKIHNRKKHKSVVSSKQPQHSKFMAKSGRSIYLNNHEIDEKISKFMTLSCDLCSINLSSLANLKTHYRTEHNTVGYITCCNKKFTQIRFLLSHIDKHSNPQNYKCPQCCKVLSTKDNYDKHIEVRHVNKQWYVCESCPRKFECSTLLERHKPIHLPKSNWDHKCSQCNRIYPSEHFLNAHMVDIHQKKNICQHCGKSFSARKFRQHQRTHTEDPNNLKMQCKICEAWLMTASGYRTHMNNHKDANLIHKCPQCEKISPNRPALKIHMKTHEISRNHQCTICEKTFKRPLALRQHMASHTGEALYHCLYCTKTFIYDSAFHTHKKRYHPLEYQTEKTKVKRTDFRKYSELRKTDNLEVK